MAIRRFRFLFGVLIMILLLGATGYVGQAFARELLASGASGVIYRSVRRRGGECIACFRPALVRHVRIGAHYEYRWEGTRTPKIRKL